MSNSVQNSDLQFDPAQLFQPEGDFTPSWSFHTTFTLDALAAAGIAGLQLANGTLPDNNALSCCQSAINPEQNPAANIAFFYNKSDGSTHADITLTPSKSLDFSGIQNYLHPLTTNQTFHAKLSFVCLENKEKNEQCYRLGVYSKNITFGAPTLLEVGMLFDLDFNAPDETSKANGSEFQSFLSHIHSCTDRSGQEWLTSHGLAPEDSKSEKSALYHKLQSFRLGWKNAPCDITAQPQLLFGGCDNGFTLARKIHFDGAEGIVLTPPVFISDGAKGFFQSQTANPNASIALYDAQNGFQSHAKLYLLHGPAPDSYRLCLGSANCTQNGIGYNFSIKGNQIDNQRTSVECLIQVSIDQKQYNSLKKALGNYYACFDLNGNAPGSLKKPSDDSPVGAFFATSSGKCKCTNVKYLDSSNNQIAGFDCSGTELTPPSASKVKEIIYIFEPAADQTVPYTSIPDELIPLDGQPVHASFWPVEYESGTVQMNVELLDANDHIVTSNISKIRVTYTLPDEKKLAASAGYLLAGTSHVLVLLPEFSKIKHMEGPAASFKPPCYISQIQKCLIENKNPPFDDWKEKLDNAKQYCTANSCMHRLIQEAEQNLNAFSEAFGSQKGS